MELIVISTPIGFLGSGKGGGVEVTLNSLVSGLLELGHKVKVIAPEKSTLSVARPGIGILLGTGIFYPYRYIKYYFSIYNKKHGLFW